MRILISANLLFPYFTGGKKRMGHHYARYLAAAGHSVRVVTQRPGPGPVRDRMDGFDVWRFATDPRGAVRYHASEVGGAVRAMRSACEDWRPDVVFAQDPNMALAAMLSPAARVPRVFCFHASWALEWRQNFEHTGGRYGSGLRTAVRRPLAGAFCGYLKALEGFVLARCDTILVLSEFSRGLLRDHFGVPPERTVLVPGTADMARFRPTERALKAGAAPRIFTLRRLASRMGLEDLIEAAALVRDSGREFSLRIGGRGALRGRLEALIAERRLTGCVQLLGYLSDEQVVEQYRRADLSVLPTIAYEGFGLATVEALACGTPVLGTRVGATPEVLGPLCEELLRDPGPESMAQGIGYWLDRRDRLADVSAACAHYARRRYSPESMVRGLERVFRSVCERR